MLKKRLIAVLIIADGRVVQSIKFKHTNVIHSDPVEAVISFTDWAVDEIVILNVSRNPDTKVNFRDTLKRICRRCFVPVTAGGWIQTVDDATALIRNGADKVIVNTVAATAPSVVTDIALRHGSQACVVSIDGKRTEPDSEPYVFIDRGRKPIGFTVVEWAVRVAELGAGEIFYNSIDHDGSRLGFDLNSAALLVKSVRVPIILFGGVQTWEHLADGLKTGVDAVAAANILHYTEQSVFRAKNFLLTNGFPVRGIE